jgi:BirA family biotin operon repressor/biotin-[acetyl-CoA-carboxylase] ligase
VLSIAYKRQVKHMTNTLFVGKVYYRFDKLPSTNDHALELIAKSRPPEGTCVRAAMQTAGRGQYGSRWESAAGENLTLSVIFYPRWLAPGDQFRLSMATALALRAAAHAVLVCNEKAGLDAVSPPKVTIKWPNDIYLADNKKTAGILIQNTLSGGHLAASVVGIGLNVNQLLFPPELPNATSLARAAGRPLDLEAVDATLLAELERHYLWLRGGGEGLEEAYLGHLYRRDVPARFERTADGSTFDGRIRGVTPAGQLIVETAHGDERFDVRQLRFLD